MQLLSIDKLGYWVVPIILSKVSNIFLKMTNKNATNNDVIANSVALLSKAFLY